MIEDDEDADGDGDVPDEDEDDEEEEEDVPPIDAALADPNFQNMCMYFLKAIDEMFSAYGDGNVQVSESTFEAVNIFVYEKVWLPLQGYPDDEDAEEAWIDVEELIAQTKKRHLAGSKKKL